MQRLSRDGGHDSAYPDIAVQGGRAALSWHDAAPGNNDIRLALFDLGALPDAVDDAALHVTTTPGDSIGAYLVWNGEQLGLAWNDDTSGQHELWFQRFDRSGAPAQRAQQLTHTTTASLIPSIAALDAGFVLAWGEVELGSGDHDGAAGSSSRGEIRARRVE